MTRKFDIGDEIYYPDLETAGTDQSRPHAWVELATVVAVVEREVNGSRVLYYQTDINPSVEQKLCFKTFAPAKRKLLALVKTHRKDIAKGLDKSIKTIKETDKDKLVYTAPTIQTRLDEEKATRDAELVEMAEVQEELNK